MEPLTAQMPDATLVGLYIVVAIAALAMLFFDPLKNQ
jgi:MFS superfamily sulfate permease-like transporter